METDLDQTPMLIVIRTAYLPPKMQLLNKSSDNLICFQRFSALAIFI